MEEGFNPDVEKMQHVMKLLRPEVCLWESLKIHVERIPLDLALELCDVAAPLLHTLSIRCSNSDGIEDQFVLFDDQTPALQNQCLVGVPVIWTGPLLHNLTSICLADFEDGLGPSVEDFISILTASSRLERLALDNAGISMRSAGDLNPEVLQMPHLQHVQMTHLDRDVYVWFALYIKAEHVHKYIGSELETVGEVDILKGCPIPNLKTLS
ncbi:hypothetical protein FRB96_004194 [Tulasnella sp. 330]|nr:hypothetical protein FRB96_004194 [Tulasnella sp. 330]